MPEPVAKMRMSEALSALRMSKPLPSTALMSSVAPAGNVAMSPAVPSTGCSPQIVCTHTRKPSMPVSELPDIYALPLATGRGAASLRSGKRLPQRSDAP